MTASVVLAGLGAGAIIAGTDAFGDTVAGTTGDISYSVTWTQAGGNQTTLVVQNTAAPGGHMISDFTFQISGGPAITGVSGGACRTTDFANQPLPAGEIQCGNALGPGQSETITITTQNGVVTGTNGSITFNDDAEAAQPAVTVPLQGSGGTTSATTTATNTTGATTTTTTAPVTTGGGGSTGTTTTPSKPCPTTGALPPACRYDLTVEITPEPDRIDGKKTPQKIGVKVTVTNDGPAASPALPAKDPDGLYFTSYAVVLYGHDQGHAVDDLDVLKKPEQCHGTDHLWCSVHGLDPGESQEFSLTVLYSRSIKNKIAAARKEDRGYGAYLGLHSDVHDRKLALCLFSETRCTNNGVTESVHGV